MATSQTDKPAEPQPADPKPFQQRPLRVWPGVIAVTLQWLAGFVLPVIFPETKLYGLMIGFLGGGLLIAAWWLFFSRAPWRERIGVILLMAVGMFAASRVVHPSIANAGMGFLLPIFAIPVLCLALVCAAVASRRLSTEPRRALLIITILLGCGLFTALRTGGMSGDGDEDLHWRWTPTPEERLLALANDQPVGRPSIVVGAKTDVIWPGFRGPERNGVVHGLRIATDWSHTPPAELWRRPIGPAWSSFAVGGGLLYTQEQRGPDEEVACYSVSTGQPVWRHHDTARFWESNGGAGPRATPTVGDGRVYTLGATGIVNSLDATDGKLIWSRNAADDTGAKVPMWGFAGSPLVVGDLVIVATAGRLVAYDRVTGEQRWLGPEGGGGYSSPHLATIDGVKQVLLLNGAGATSVEPATGNELWKYAWRSDGVVQPALTGDGDILIGSGSGLGDIGVGVRRIAVAHGTGGWTTQERWTSSGLKPYFNDFVIHKGNAFGFDGGILACISLADGKRQWKGGRYGHGQVIALADQDVLVVLSETGQLALVAAKPDEFKELARLPSIQGKTWNHPALAGDILLARNGEEMVAYRLPSPGR